FGPELKCAGYDMIAIRGIAPTPTLLCIDHRGPRLEPADALWGRDTVDTERMIRDRFKDQAMKVATIGPAGENLVRFAAIQASPNRSFGRCGLGAVLGSKRLKAICVRGTRRIPLADSTRFGEVARSMHARIRANPLFPTVSRYGTASLVLLANEIGRFPTRNFQNGEFDEAESISAEILHDRYWVRDEGCHACPIRCDKIYRIEQGPRSGLEVSSLEYETLNSFGSNVGCADIEAILEANDLCDRLGMDTISAGRAVSFAMELHQHGKLPPSVCRELDLSWGNTETILKLVRMIAARDGFGDLLAEGVRHAAHSLGDGCSQYAMHVKGMEIPAQDGRAQQSMGLAHITSNRGADHLKAFPTIDETGLPDEVARRYGHRYLPEMADPRATRHKPFLVKDGEDFGAVVDSLGVCKSGGTFVMAEIYWPDLTKGLQLATGWDIDEAELREIGERITNQMRAYNALHGISRCDDRLPRRFTEEPSPSRGARGEVAHAEEMLDAYYALRGWDPVNGWPTPETLQRLNLADVESTLNRSRRPSDKLDREGETP
ncbi:aldehyde ferredoxin oxidoreductase family protein, partial [Candidatus Bipolaricaulota bacterium]|nr:aldehyde ferredoxin oxidoreductase family protein [Candidatus Bipolaricaulota bacterium]